MNANTRDCFDRIFASLSHLFTLARYNETNGDVWRSVMCRLRIDIDYLPNDMHRIAICEAFCTRCPNGERVILIAQAVATILGDIAETDMDRTHLMALMDLMSADAERTANIANANNTLLQECVVAIYNADLADGYETDDDTRACILSLQDDTMPKPK